jgi:hypothetical protein
MITRHNMSLSWIILSTTTQIRHLYGFQELIVLVCLLIRQAVGLGADQHVLNGCGQQALLSGSIFTDIPTITGDDGCPNQHNRGCSCFVVG